MAQATISFKIRATGPDLFFSAQLNGRPFIVQRVQGEWTEFVHSFEDHPGAYVLELEMAGKEPHHTEIDPEGNIIKDRWIEVRDFAMQGIPLAHALIEHSYYLHNFNGTGDTVRMGFYGDMGCNGVVRFEFSGPATLWLLENT